MLPLTAAPAAPAALSELAPPPVAPVAAVPALSFVAVLSEQLTAPLGDPPEGDLPGEGELPEGDALAFLDVAPVALVELLQQAQPEAPPSAPSTLSAPPAGLEAPPGTPLAVGMEPAPDAPPDPAPSAEAQPPAEAPSAALEASEPPATFQVSEAPAAVAGEALEPSAGVKSTARVAEAPPPPPAELATESGEAEIRYRPVGLDKLSLRVQQGGERIDVDIERGVDRALDVRVVAPAEAIDDLASMEQELHRSLEERALKLGSYSAEAREQGADADTNAGGESASGEGGVLAEEEADSAPSWVQGLLNIRA